MPCEIQGEILDTSHYVPQPLWSCGGTAQSPHMLLPAPLGSLFASVPVPGHPVVSGHSIFPSLLRVLIVPEVPTTHQVPITSQVPIVSWGPHCPWGPHHPWGVHYPSRSSLLLGVPVTFRVPTVPGISLTPTRPSPLVSCCPCVPFIPSGVPNTTGVPISPNVTTLCPHNLQVPTVPGIPITPGVLIIPQGPHYSLKSPLPSASPLSMCSPLILRTPGSHHPWDSTTP